MLRHTAASLMADAGVPIEEVADQLDTRMASLHSRHRIRPTVSGGTTLGAVLAEVGVLGNLRDVARSESTDGTRLTPTGGGT